MYSFTGPTVHSFRPALDEFIQEESGTGIRFILMNETIEATLTFVNCLLFCGNSDRQSRSV